MDRIRNSKGKFIKENEGDITKFNPTFQELLNYLWIIAKLSLIIILVYPFIDKLRQKDYFIKVGQFISDLDFGCKICDCLNINSTTSSTMNPADVFKNK